MSEVAYREGTADANVVIPTAMATPVAARAETRKVRRLITGFSWRDGGVWVSCQRRNGANGVKGQKRPREYRKCCVELQVKPRPTMDVCLRAGTTAWAQGVARRPFLTFDRIGGGVPVTRTFYTEASRLRAGYKTPAGDPRHSPGRRDSVGLQG
ncbi:hypothetical protein GCM10018793_41150 [Streptomyces sulfonofaciens]|uniref:Uncharacterized protein n=1 Tax=Streptomyces sulfonofaciens TaxID=68272 RepID=A0A919L256_9ACTN|nr:hypothetical protein GCM10018793_41150 [Streptomyces sulfonofaciens]